MHLCPSALPLCYHMPILAALLLLLPLLLLLLLAVVVLVQPHPVPGARAYGPAMHRPRGTAPHPTPPRPGLYWQMMLKCNPC
jgi:hypothetical protein